MRTSIRLLDIVANVAHNKIQKAAGYADEVLAELLKNDEIIKVLRKKLNDANWKNAKNEVLKLQQDLRTAVTITVNNSPCKNEVKQEIKASFCFDTVTFKSINNYWGALKTRLLFQTKEPDSKIYSLPISIKNTLPSSDELNKTEVPELLLNRITNETPVEITNKTLSENFKNRLITAKTTIKNIKQMREEIYNVTRNRRALTTVKKLMADPVLWPLVKNDTEVINKIKEMESLETAKKERIQQAKIQKEESLKLKRETEAAQRKQLLEDIKSGKVVPETVVNITKEKPKVNIGLINAINRMGELNASKNDESKG